MDGGHKVSSGLHCEPIVKIEPPEDVKDIKNDLFNLSHTGSTLWPFLLKSVRYKYQKDHGRRMDYVKMTKLLLLEVEHLLNEVSSFVRSCSSSLTNGDNVIEISESMVRFIPNSRIQIAEPNVIPEQYKDSIFAPLQKKEIDIMDVEQSMIHSVFQNDPDDPNCHDDDLDALPSFPDHMELPDDFKLETATLANSTSVSPSALAASAAADEAFPPLPTSGYPEPILVPGKEGGKIKTFYKCEKCHKSFPKRKRYYNHKFNNKCTIEPKWIRWHKNHKRVECAHPNCIDKTHINYTYPGLMKHIIEMHTIQEDSVRSLNFP